MQPRNNYDISFIEKVTTSRFGFELFSMPDYSWKFTDIVFEEMTALLVRQLANGTKTFIDIGAHYGFYSVLVGTTNPEVEIFAFEPILENFEVLNKNLRINAVEARAFMKAVSNFEGRSKFQMSEQSSQSGFIANPDVGVLKETEVDVVMLDNFKNSISEGSVIVKMDTEGNELNVLDGMKNLIENIVDIRLLIEFNPNCLIANGVNPQDFLYSIENLGFDIFIICDAELHYKKYQSGIDWQNLMGERTYRNLYCIKKTQQSLNLCFFSHSSQLAGAERSLLTLVKELTINYNTLCTVILPSNGPLENLLQEAGASTIVAPLYWWCSGTKLPDPAKINERYRQSFSWLNENLQLLEQINPDFVLTNTLTIPWGGLAAFMLSRPHVWMVKEFGVLDHGLKFFLPFNQVIKFIARASEIIVTCSKVLKDELFASLQPDKVHTIYNQIKIDEKVNTSKGAKYDYFTLTGAYHLIIAGSIMESKGQEDAVRSVIELVKNRNRQVELVIVGYAQPDYKNYLQNIIDEEKLNKYIHIIPFQENVFPIINLADVLLVCSRMEAFGRVTLEGLLMQKAVIATNTGGTPEIITEGETGLLYSPGDYLQLADQIEKLMDNPDLQKELTIKGYEFASKTFTKENSVVAYHKLLMNLKNEVKKNKDNVLCFLMDQYQGLITQNKQEIKTLEAQRSELEHKIQSLTAQVQDQDREVLYYALSRSWRITRPLRKLMKLIKRKRNACNII